MGKSKEVEMEWEKQVEVLEGVVREMAGKIRGDQRRFWQILKIVRGGEREEGRGPSGSKKWGRVWGNGEGGDD